MTAMEALLVLALVVVGVWLVGGIADALIGHSPLGRVTRYARARAPQARQVLARCRTELDRARRAGRRLTRA